MIKKPHFHSIRSSHGVMSRDIRLGARSKHDVLFAWAVLIEASHRSFAPLHHQTQTLSLATGHLPKKKPIGNSHS